MLAYSSICLFTPVYANLHQNMLTYTSICSLTPVYDNLHLYMLTYSSVCYFTLVCANFQSVPSYFFTVVFVNSQSVITYSSLCWLILVCTFLLRSVWNSHSWTSPDCFTTIAFTATPRKYIFGIYFASRSCNCGNFIAQRLPTETLALHPS